MPNIFQKCFLLEEMRLESTPLMDLHPSHAYVKTERTPKLYILELDLYIVDFQKLNFV